MTHCPHIIALSIIAASASPAALGARIYVDQSALQTETGATWGNAYRSLQTALAAADSGDEIWVANGVYKPATPSTPNPRAARFEMKHGVMLYGGFHGAISTATAARPPAPSATPSRTRPSSRGTSTATTRRTSATAPTTLSTSSIASTLPYRPRSTGSSSRAATPTARSATRPAAASWSSQVPSMSSTDGSVRVQPR